MNICSLFHFPRHSENKVGACFRLFQIIQKQKRKNLCTKCQVSCRVVHLGITHNVKALLLGLLVCFVLLERINRLVI